MTSAPSAYPGIAASDGTLVTGKDAIDQRWAEYRASMSAGRLFPSRATQHGSNMLLPCRSLVEWT
eukprot:5194743-Alexandrium_andersonii.AAC.1